MHYNFPKTRFANAKDWTPQVEHLLSEADEVAVEFKKWKRRPEGERNSGPLFGEIFDLLHSIETFVGIIPVFVFNQMVKEIIAKNTERGYYDVKGAMSEPSAEEIKAECGFREFGTLEPNTGPLVDGVVPSWGSFTLAEDIIVDKHAMGPDKIELPGGSTPSQYAIPKHATELQDLIEHRDMNFAVGNIFKACYRRGKCSHSDELRDARKNLWFAQREVNRLEGEA